jgi:hypothetical protein
MSVLAGTTSHDLPKLPTGVNQNAMGIIPDSPLTNPPSNESNKDLDSESNDNDLDRNLTRKTPATESPPGSPAIEGAKQNSIRRPRGIDQLGKHLNYVY